MNDKIIIALIVLTGLVDMLMSERVRRENKALKNLLMAVFVAAGIVTWGYAGSLMAQTYQQASVCSSIYFAAIDYMLLFASMYAVRFTNRRTREAHGPVLRLVIVLVILDSLVLLTNPIHQKSIRYYYVADTVAHWRYLPHFPFRCHLVLSYLLLANILMSLLVKIIRSPKVYRRRYSLLLYGIAGVVLMNAVFLYLPQKNLFDFSVLFYSVICGVLFWNNNHYSQKGMLAEVNMMVLGELNHPLVLFDYEDCYTMSNRIAGRLLEGVDLNQVYTLPEFVRRWGFERELRDMDQNHAFQWEFIQGEEHTLYRCDYTVLRDAQNRIIGRLFMFTDRSLAVDLLTGFFSESSMKKQFEYNHDRLVYPVGAAICDINCLSVINSRMGKEEGDRAIKMLAQMIRQSVPEGTYCARLNDAVLLFLCQDTDITRMREYIAKIQEKLEKVDQFVIPLRMQSAISMATVKKPSIMEAVSAAVKSMKARKMMDASSAHSSLLDSFAQTLQESDSCTREHVKRTQVLGEKLGIRMGLSDVDLSNLALLCLLHDIGKLGIPLEILNKPGRLSEAEWTVMRTHTIKGYRIAKASHELEDIADLILHHHECWDGSGYPDGLKKETIPLLSRIISVVDTYDAMTNDRPYRRGMSREDAVAELRRCAGTQFDPYIVSEFIEMLRQDSGYQEKNHRQTETQTQEPRILPRGIEQAVPVEKGYLFAVSHTIYILDEKDQIIDIDDEFVRITGYNRDDIRKYQLGQLDLVTPEDLAQYKEMVGAMLSRSGSAFVEHRVLKKDGTSIKVLCYGRRYYDSVTREGRSRIMMTDLSECEATKALVQEVKDSARRSMEKWEDSVRRDALTGLLNRVAFQNDVQHQLLLRQHAMVMLMMDIDIFKHFNDTYGHKRGDEILIGFAQSLREAVGSWGIAARMGGDEFAALLMFEPSVRQEHMIKTAGQVWEKLSQDLHAIQDEATVSMGIVRVPDEVDNFNELYSMVDEALYQAKEQGRNRYIVRN